MSYRIGNTIVTLTCDKCGHTKFEDKRGRPNLQTIQTLWREAESAGWTSTSTKHYCRKHSED